jgi:triosephosphate isomerase
MASRAFARELLDALVAVKPLSALELAVFPPMPYIGGLVEQFGESAIRFGAQDVDVHEQGAFTGEVGAAMLRDIGCKYVLVGHSERREYHEETSDLVARKFQAAKHGGLIPVLCVGETLHQREAGRSSGRWSASSSRSGN